MSLGVTVVDFQSLKRALKNGVQYKAPVNIRGWIYKLPIFLDAKTKTMWTHRQRPKKMKSKNEKGQDVFINTDIMVYDVCEVITIAGAFYAKDPMTLEISEFEGLN